MNKFNIIVMLFLGIMMASCGGKKIVMGTPSEVVVPDELASAFEVKDYSNKKPEQPLQKLNAKNSTEKNSNDKKMKSKNKSNTTEAKAELSTTDRRPKVDPIWIGERIFMDVSWLKTRAGEFELSVEPFKVVNNKKVYHFKGVARTADFFSWIYKAEDSVESFVDFDGWFPYKFILKGDETKYKRDYLELFDHVAKKQYVHTVNHKLKTGEVTEDKGYKDLTPYSQDSISALYYARTQDMKEGTSVKFPMTTNGRQWETELKVIGKEELNTKAGTIQAIKTQVFTSFNGVLQQKGESFMWFSDDEKKYPVKFEAKVKIGWVTGLVKKIEAGTAPSASSQLKIEDEMRVATAEATSSGLEKTSKSGKLKEKNKAWFQNLLKEEDQHE